MLRASTVNNPNIHYPEHIGIIMDGNGRWAKQRGLPRNMGHRQGAKVFREISIHCRDIGVRYLTVFAFSTENWSRPPEEVNAIMNLLRQYLDEVEDHAKENVRLLFPGEREQLPPDLQARLEDVEKRSAENTGITVNVALNYGGRREIVRAAQKLAEQVQRGELRPEEITEEQFAGSLYSAGQPNPDLIIRPSGEQRLSNFLLWQAAYAELVFMDVLWPDFTTAHLMKAIEEYSQRNRRFGGI